MDNELRKQIIQGIFAILIYSLGSGLAVQFFKHFK